MPRSAPPSTRIPRSSILASVRSSGSSMSARRVRSASPRRGSNRSSTASTAATCSRSCASPTSGSSSSVAGPSPSVHGADSPVASRSTSSSRYRPLAESSRYAAIAVSWAGAPRSTPRARAARQSAFRSWPTTGVLDQRGEHRRHLAGRHRGRSPRRSVRPRRGLARSSPTKEAATTTGLPSSAADRAERAGIVRRRRTPRGVAVAGRGGLATDTGPEAAAVELGLEARPQPLHLEGVERGLGSRAIPPSEREGHGVAVELEVAHEHHDLCVAPRERLVGREVLAQLRRERRRGPRRARRGRRTGESSLAAVFSPTPGTPGRLSEGSPRSAASRG